MINEKKDWVGTSGVGVVSGASVKPLVLKKGSIVEWAFRVGDKSNRVIEEEVFVSSAYTVVWRNKGIPRYRITCTFLVWGNYSGKEKAYKHKQICGIVPGLGGCQNFVYVFFGAFLMGRKTHKQSHPKIPGQSRENFVYGLFSLCVFFRSQITIVTTNITDPKSVQRVSSWNLLPDNNRDKFQANSLVIIAISLPALRKCRSTDYRAEILAELGW